MTPEPVQSIDQEIVPRPFFNTHTRKRLRLVAGILGLINLPLIALVTTIRITEKDNFYTIISGTIFDVGHTGWIAALISLGAGIPAIALIVSALLACIPRKVASWGERFEKYFWWSLTIVYAVFIFLILFSLLAFGTAVIRI